MVDLFLVPETFGLALAGLIFSIIAIVKLAKFSRYDDKQFMSQRSTLFIWGITTNFTSALLGGILTLVAYFALPATNVTGQLNNNTPLTLEQAFELKEKGVLSDEEYGNLKQ